MKNKTNLQDLLKIIQAVVAHDLTELTWVHDNETIILKRAATDGVAVLEAHVAEEAVPVSPSKPTLEPEGYAQTSPMVGTVYLASSPDVPPFVTVNKMVKKGDTLCIIEAMKLFNHVEAERSGVILQCYIDNAQAVEYGQPLFLIGDAH
jgi:acetyl-CoA carboxylase biotin carboxyl carrier protein